MAHWAQIDENNIVTNVIVTSNDEIDEGYSWVTETLGGTWIKTSYNTYGGIHKNDGIPLRKNYAGIGFTYDSEKDAFIPPQNYPSWTLNQETCLWNAPVEYPQDGKLYYWDESIINWVEING